MSTNYICLDTEVSIPGIARNMSYGFVVREQDGALMGWHERDFTGYAATQTDTGDTFLTQFSNKNTPCLKQLLAHETLHRALYLTPGWIHWARRFQLPWFPRLSDVYQKSGLIFNLPQATKGPAMNKSIEAGSSEQIPGDRPDLAYVIYVVGERRDDGS